MAKDMRTQPTSPNSMPMPQPAGLFKKNELLATAASRPPPDTLFGKRIRPAMAGRDVEMEFEDVGCVGKSFAINANQYPAHSN